MIVLQVPWAHFLQYASVTTRGERERDAWRGRGARGRVRARTDIAVGVLGEVRLDELVLLLRDDLLALALERGEGGAALLRDRVTA